MGALVVESAVPSDLQTLAFIDRSGVHGEDRRAMLEASVRQGNAYIARVTGDPVGFLLMGHWFFDRPFIGLVMVDPNHRRTGVGSALLRHVQATYSGQDIFTSTNQSNQTAQALFVRCGFRRCGWIEELDPGDPELIYVWSGE